MADQKLLMRRSAINAHNAASPSSAGSGSGSSNAPARAIRDRICKVRRSAISSSGDIKPEQYKANGKSLPKVIGADAADQQVDVPIYRVDGLVRRATALQLTPEGKRAASSDS